MASGAMAQFASSPADVIKVRMQTEYGRMRAGLPPQYRYVVGRGWLGLVNMTRNTFMPSHDFRIKIYLLKETIPAIIIINRPTNTGTRGRPSSPWRRRAASGPCGEGGPPTASGPLSSSLGT